MSKTRFYMVVGLPGSGKTYWAYNQARPYDVVLDSDEIRFEEYGDASCQENPDRIFNIMFQRTRAALRAGRNVYYVATNLSSRRRINLLKSLKKNFDKIQYHCVVIATPIDICHERNMNRERVVPTEVINRMMRQFEVPYENEGWNNIFVVHHKEENTMGGDPMTYRYKYGIIVRNYGSQNNSHHVLSLEEHCEKCGALAREYYRKNSLSINSNLIWAALFHDYGKVWTATRWEKDNYEEAHYPNHANVGSYMALTMGYNLHIAQLIGYHMIPYTDKKCQEAWRIRLGDKLWEEINLLHQFDEAAH